MSNRDGVEPTGSTPITRQAELSTITDKLNRLWELIEKHPKSPKYVARERRWLELLTDYERVHDAPDAQW